MLNDRIYKMKLLELANVVQDNHVVGVTASISVHVHSLAHSGTIVSRAVSHSAPLYQIPS